MKMQTINQIFVKRVIVFNHRVFVLICYGIIIACCVMTSKVKAASDEATTATMTANTSYQIGDVVQTAGFFLGNNGGGIYDVVATTSVTPNGMDILIGSDTSVSFKLRGKGVIDVMQYGLQAGVCRP